MVQRAWKVSAMLLCLSGPDPGLRPGWSGPPVHHYQSVQRVAAGSRDSSVPAGPGHSPEAAAELCCAGYELCEESAAH